MQGMELVTPETKQVVLCENDAIAAVVTPVCFEATVVVYPLHLPPEEHAAACSVLADHDVICLGFMPMLMISDAKPAKIRVFDGTIPADFSLSWLRTALQPYPATDTALRTVQPYNPDSEPQKGQAARPPNGAGPSPDAALSPSASELSTDDLQAILGDSEGEDIGEPPEYATEGPEPELTVIDGKRYDLSMQFPSTAKSAWPNPLDPFAVASQPPEFDTAVFTGDLAFLDTFCSDLSELKGTDYGIAALAALTSLSAWVHESWLLQVKQFDGTWREAGRFWGFVCGDSSDGKSVGLNLATKPARDLDALAAKEAAVQVAKYASDCRIHEKRVTEYEKRAADNKLNPGEIMPPAPERIEIDQRLFRDANWEGFRKLLETTPKGWLYTDELSAFIANMGKYSAQKDAGIGERGGWLQAWDGGAYNTLRASKPIALDSVSAVILGGGTPDSLRATLGSGKLQGDGFIQRFCVYNTRHQRQDLDHEQDKDALATMQRTLAALREMRPANDQPLRLSPDAYQYFRGFMDRLTERCDSGLHNSACQSHILKFRSNAVRLALILHLAMRGATGTECNAGEYVELPILKMACDICEQLIPHTVYFWEKVLRDGDVQFSLDVQSVCEAIACWHLGDGTEAPSELSVTLQEILNSCKKLKIETPADVPRAARAITGVFYLSWLDDHPSARNAKYGGGLKTRYLVNPKLRSIWEDNENIIAARKRRLETPKNIGANFQHLRVVS